MLILVGFGPRYFSSRLFLSSFAASCLLVGLRWNEGNCTCFWQRFSEGKEGATTFCASLVIKWWLNILKQHFEGVQSFSRVSIFFPWPLSRRKSKNSWWHQEVRRRSLLSECFKSGPWFFQRCQGCILFFFFPKKLNHFGWLGWSPKFETHPFVLLIYNNIWYNIWYEDTKSTLSNMNLPPRRNCVLGFRSPRCCRQIVEGNCEVDIISA